jgi:hypothetical protein
MRNRVEAARSFGTCEQLIPESGVNLAISEVNRLQSVDFPENAIRQVL